MGIHNKHNIVWQEVHLYSVMLQRETGGSEERMYYLITLFN